MNCNVVDSAMRKELGLKKQLKFQRDYLYQKAINMDISLFKKVCYNVHRTDVRCMDIDESQGRYLLTGSSNGTLVIYDMEGDKSCLFNWCHPVWKSSPSEGPPKTVEGVKWYPIDGKVFVTGSSDDTLKIWDATSMTVVETHRYSGLRCFDLSRCSTNKCVVAVGNKDGSIALLEMQSGARIHTISSNRSKITSLNWSPLDDRILMSTTADCRILLWDVRSSRTFLRNLDRDANVYNRSAPSETAYAHRRSLLCSQFVENGRKIISVGKDGIRLWDSNSGLNELVQYGEYSPHHSNHKLKIACTTESGKPVVYVPCGNKINVYNLRGGNLFTKLGGHFKAVTYCVLNPRTHDLYASSLDGTIQVYSNDKDREEVVKKMSKKEKKLKLNRRNCARCEEDNPEEAYMAFGRLRRHVSSEREWVSFEIVTFARRAIRGVVRKKITIPCQTAANPTFKVGNTTVIYVLKNITAVLEIYI